MVDPRLGTTIDGRYRLDEHLAAGGMGVVYKAERIGIAKVVAIKFLHDSFAMQPDLVKRFELEAVTMSRLTHPHIVSIIDHGIAGGTPYLVMEFHAGHSLASVLKDGALPPRRAVAITRQILAGIRHAHELGIVHRDLKPDNILLLSGLEGDFVKILDFGLAKLVGGGDPSQRMTTAGFALGTPGYMSPEQASGTKLDPRADLYSLGIMLFEMVVGHKPFRAGSPIVLLRMQMEDKPPRPRQAAPLAGISPELDAAILRAIEKSPAQRFKSAEEFARALEATREASSSEVSAILPAALAPQVARDRSPSVPSIERRMTSIERAPKRMVAIVRRRSVLLGVVGVALAAVLGVLFGWAKLYPESAEHARRKLEEAGRAMMGAQRDGGVEAERSEPGAKRLVGSKSKSKKKRQRARR